MLRRITHNNGGRGWMTSFSAEKTPSCSLLTMLCLSSPLPPGSDETFCCMFLPVLAEGGMIDKIFEV